MRRKLLTLNIKNVRSLNQKPSNKINYYILSLIFSFIVPSSLSSPQPTLFTRCFFLIFFVNLSINYNHTTIQLCVYGREIPIMDIDLHIYLCISNAIIYAHSNMKNPFLNWSIVKAIIRNLPLQQHMPLVSGLMLNTCAIQHMLIHNVIAEIGDFISITPLISIITYFFMTNTIFNGVDVLITL